MSPPHVAFVTFATLPFACEKFHKVLNSRTEMQDEPHGRPDTAGPPASSTGLGTAGKYAGIGIQFGASIVLFLYVGQWVDRRLGTTPIFLIVGVFVGATAAFYSIYKRLMRDLKKEEEAQSRASKDA